MANRARDVTRRLAEASSRLPALLETTVTESDGSDCRVTSPAILVAQGLARDALHRRPGQGIAARRTGAGVQITASRRRRSISSAA